MLKVSLFLFALLGAALGVLANGDGSEEGWRIVGGSNASITDAAYQVSLRSTNNNHFCGGSIINARTIVTAARCVLDISASDVMVVVGTISLYSGGMFYTVSRITIHPSYQPSDNSNDIAVVITSTPITGIANVRSIALYPDAVGAGVGLSVTGWGATSFLGVLSNNLQIIYVLTLGVGECQEKMSGIGEIYSTNICTVSQTIGKGTCHGDIGSPLVGNGMLIGIMSWGYRCASGYPDVFTRVRDYANWINQNSQN